VSATGGESLPYSLAKEGKPSSRVAILAVVVVAILVVGAVAWLAVQSGNKKSGYTKHNPISIVGNANFTAANGVIGGSGNASDPYIIANWVVDAAHSVGIYIESTSAHFIIRNCHVHGGSTISGGMQVGINLDNCSNGIVDSNECSDNLIGVVLESFSGLSHNNTIVNNTCNSNDQNGIAIVSSNNNTLISNKCLSNGRWGIVLDSSSNNIVCKNSILHNTDFGIGIDPDHGQTSTHNRLWNNTFIGNNGAGSKYGSSHIQANDSGTGNWWNSTDGHGNYWSDWTTPDANHDGVVDNPYSIVGNAGTKDYYPLTESPVPI